MNVACSIGVCNVAEAIEAVPLPNYVFPWRCWDERFLFPRSSTMGAFRTSFVRCQFRHHLFAAYYCVRLPGVTISAWPFALPHRSLAFLDRH